MTTSTSFFPNYQDIINYSISHKISWYQLFLFELKSLVGRHFFKERKPPIVLNRANFLNLGAGFSPIVDDCWINADFFSGFQLRKKEEFYPNWMLDLRYPLLCPDNVWDGVFTEHTLEHLYPDEVFNLLREIHRTMKPKAWLRISVPDLQQYVDYYEGRSVHPTFLKWPTGCEAIHALTQNHQHLSVWDFQLLTRFLENVGFTKIQKVSFYEGTDMRLCLDQELRRWETLYIEAQKP